MPGSTKNSGRHHGASPESPIVERTKDCSRDILTLSSDDDGATRLRKSPNQSQSYRYRSRSRSSRHCYSRSRSGSSSRYYYEKRRHRSKYRHERTSRSSSCSSNNGKSGRNHYKFKRSKSRYRSPGRSGSRYPSSSRYSSRDRSGSRYATRDRSESRYLSRDRSGSRYLSRDRSGSRYDSRDRSGSRYLSRDRSGSKYPSRDESRSRHPSRGSNRCRHRSRGSSRSRHRSRGSSRSRHRSRGSSRSRHPSRVSSRSRHPSRSRSKSKYPSRHSKRRRRHKKKASSSDEDRKRKLEMKRSKISLLIEKARKAEMQRNIYAKSGEDVAPDVSSDDDWASSTKLKTIKKKSSIEISLLCNRKRSSEKPDSTPALLNSTDAPSLESETVKLELDPRLGHSARTACAFVDNDETPIKVINIQDVSVSTNPKHSEASNSLIRHPSVVAVCDAPTRVKHEPDEVGDDHSPVVSPTGIDSIFQPTTFKYCFNEWRGKTDDASSVSSNATLVNSDSVVEPFSILPCVKMEDFGNFGTDVQMARSFTSFKVLIVLRQKRPLIKQLLVASWRFVYLTLYPQSDRLMHPDSTFIESQLSVLPCKGFSRRFDSSMGQCTLCSYQIVLMASPGVFHFDRIKGVPQRHPEEQRIERFLLGLDDDDDVQRATADMGPCSSASTRKPASSVKGSKKTRPSVASRPKRKTTSSDELPTGIAKKRKVTRKPKRKSNVEDESPYVVKLKPSELMEMSRDRSQMQLRKRPPYKEIPLITIPGTPKRNGRPKKKGVANNLNVACEIIHVGNSSEDEPFLSARLMSVTPFGKNIAGARNPKKGTEMVEKNNGCNEVEKTNERQKKADSMEVKLVKLERTAGPSDDEKRNWAMTHSEVKDFFKRLMAQFDKFGEKLNSQSNKELVQLRDQQLLLRLEAQKLKLNNTSTNSPYADIDQKVLLASEGIIDGNLKHIEYILFQERNPTRSSHEDTIEKHLKSSEKNPEVVDLTGSSSKESGGRQTVEHGQSGRISSSILDFCIENATMPKLTPSERPPSSDRTSKLSVKDKRPRLIGNGRSEIPTGRFKSPIPTGHSKSSTLTSVFKSSTLTSVFKSPTPSSVFKSPTPSSVFKSPSPTSVVKSPTLACQFKTMTPTGQGIDPRQTGHVPRSTVSIESPRPPYASFDWQHSSATHHHKNPPMPFPSPFIRSLQNVNSGFTSVSNGFATMAQGPISSFPSFGAAYNAWTNNNIVTNPHLPYYNPMLAMQQDSGFVNHAQQGVGGFVGGNQVPLQSCLGNPSSHATVNNSFLASWSSVPGNAEQSSSAPKFAAENHNTRSRWDKK